MKHAHFAPAFALLAALFPGEAWGGEEKIKIGWATVDITPDFPVELMGMAFGRPVDPKQHHDPISATVLALESESESESESKKEQAVLISVDLLWVNDMVPRLRTMLEPRIKDLDLGKIFMFATHNHTGPYMHDDSYYPYIPTASTGDEYRDFMLGRVAEGVVKAWKEREFGAVGWARSQAAVGFCRISVYGGGNASIYGNPHQSDFKEMEAAHDHGAELLYTFDGSKKITGVVVNVASPSQMVMNKRELSADFWGPARRQLRANSTFGKGLHVLAMCGAAGDQSPHDLQDKSIGHHEQHDWPVLEMLGNRVAQAVDTGYSEAKKDAKARLEFRHLVKEIELPKKPEVGGKFGMELHVVRIGDVAVVNNAFELYIDFGFQMKEASPAKQTFIAQLSGIPGHGGYLPSEKALKGGAYGARTENGMVGPEGGRILVAETVDLIRKMGPWPAGAKERTKSGAR